MPMQSGRSQKVFQSSYYDLLESIGVLTFMPALWFTCISNLDIDIEVTHFFFTWSDKRKDKYKYVFILMINIDILRGLYTQHNQISML